MTQIDENALEAAIEQLFDNSEEDTWRCRGRKMITAYLEALPPAGDVGELVHDLRQRHEDRTFCHDCFDGQRERAADALTAQAARIAELERKLKNFADATALSVAEQFDKANAANARAERLEAGLKHYVELFCEQPNEHSCGTFHDDFCLGCKGRAALPKG